MFGTKFSVTMLLMIVHQGNVTVFQSEQLLLNQAIIKFEYEQTYDINLSSYQKNSFNLSNCKALIICLFITFILKLG